MNLQTIYHGIQNDLQEIETGLFASLKTDNPELQAAASHLLLAGGKRIRPIFVLLSGRFGDYSFPRLRQLAVIIELVHMATLVHDDVIDNAELRRGKPTVKAKWDNQIAMLSGDYILACALQELCDFSDIRVHQLLSRTLIEMSLGEIEQIRDLYQEKLTLKQYLRRIKRKTALLIMMSCKLGAMTSQTLPEIERHLTAYGYYVGMAFQMVDDILDFTGSEEELGKPAGSDLKQGNVTLPVIYALENLAPEKRQPIQAFLASRGELDRPALTEVLALIKESGGIEYTQQLANWYFQKAERSLAQLPEQIEKESLKKIAEFIVKRNY